MTRRLLLTLAALLVSCSAPKCASDRTKQDSGEHTSGALTTLIPRGADAVLFLGRLNELGVLSGALDAAMPGEQSAALCGALGGVGLDPCSSASWAERGFDLASPAAIVVDRGVLGVVGLRLRDPGAFRAWWYDDVEAKATSGTLVRERASGWTIRGSSESGSITMGTRGDSVVLAMPIPGATLKDSVGARVASWATLAPEQRWDADPEHRKVAEELEVFGAMYAVARSSVWIGGLRATNARSEELRDRLSAESGLVGVAAQYIKDANLVRMRVLVTEDRGEPAALRSLGQARGELPSLGELVVPGVLGVGRLSANPQTFFELVQSATPPKRRAAVERLLEQVRTEFALDLEDMVLRNLTGHAVAVVYGFEPEWFERSPEEMVRDALLFDATREAIFLPIEDRKKMSLLLDAMTQITDSKLSRQRVDPVTQYAWLEDGELSWALILHEEYVIVVDSAPAFERAMKYVRNPAPLAPGLDRLGLTRLFEDTLSAGAYVDLGSMRTLFRDTDARVMASWLEPYDTVLVLNRDRDDASVLEIELRLDE